MDEVLQQQIRDKIPKGAVLMSKEEALYHQMQIVHKWEPQREVWPLVYGRSLLGLSAGFTGAYINYRFRRKLKLMDHGLGSTFIGVSFAPIITTILLHTQIILRKLYLLEIPCPLCLQTKSALLQVGTGLLMPIALTPFANFAISAGSGYNIPHLSDVKGIFKIVRSAYQPLLPHIALAFILHALFAGFITYSEIKSFLYIQNMQYLIEQDMREQMRSSKKH